MGKTNFSFSKQPFKTKPFLGNSVILLFVGLSSESLEEVSILFFDSSKANMILRIVFCIAKDVSRSPSQLILRTEPALVE